MKTISKRLMLGALAMTLSAGVMASPVTSVSSPTPHLTNSLAGEYSVTVWNGDPTNNQSTIYADLANKPSGQAVASFDFTGPLDWVNSNAQSGSNTFAEFFGFGNPSDPTNYNFSSLSNYSGTQTETQFASTAMSSKGMYQSGDLSTYMLISGVFTAPSSGVKVQVAHDDGASLYIDNSTVFSYKDPTVESWSKIYGISGGLHSFQLAYVEANGAPSDLIFNTSTPLQASVPEPATIALLALGLLGISLRLRSKPTSKQ